MKNLRNILVLTVSFIAAAQVGNAQVSLQQIGGASVDVQAQKGKVVVLAYGASWIPQLSAKQVEYTNFIAKKYAGRNVVVYFVATDSANQKSKNFATDDMLAKFGAELKLNVPLLRDPDGVTMKKFRIDQLPTFIVLDKNGVVNGDAFGGIDPKYDVTIPISKRIDSLL